MPEWKSWDPEIQRQFLFSPPDREYMLICSTEMDGNFTPSSLKGGKPEILLRWFFFPHYRNLSEVYIHTCQASGIRSRWLWSAPPGASPPPCPLPRTPLQLPTDLPYPAMAPQSWAGLGGWCPSLALDCSHPNWSIRQVLGLLLASPAQPTCLPCSWLVRSCPALPTLGIPLDSHH